MGERNNRLEEISKPEDGQLSEMLDGWDQLDNELSFFTFRLFS